MQALISQAELAITAHPDTLVFPIEYKGETYWVKRRPHSKLTFWHYLQKGLSVIIPIAILKPTASMGGQDSLHFEASQLDTLYKQGLPVPKCVYAGDTFLITKDTGIPLPKVLQELSSEAEKQALIINAAETLSQFHQAGVCHGRPAIKDMTVLAGQVTLLDFEENPLQVMTQAEAQARDIWLFLMSVALFCKADDGRLSQAFNIDAATFKALQRLYRWLRPVDKLLRVLHLEACGKDILKASRAMWVLDRLVSVGPRPNLH